MEVFSTVLIANRGEIALRIMSTCARLGLRTVAIYTEPDATAAHVRTADVAVRVDSYLDIDRVIAAAAETGAEAIHPGYGFLSERADFASAVDAAGLALVGPTAQVMADMGRKDAARDIASRAGVPVVPRFDAVSDADFPVLVKAAAGGGGKGMRIVHTAADLDDAMAAAKREASAAFGDDTMLIEKLVTRGRHLEVQILADQFGTVLHLFERDCSAQRRHQKVIEEAPAPGITTQLRTALTTSAVALATAVDYTGAGTVEFLLDTDSGDFYFLEMNTRLQVEHPVTEAITGNLDLVEWQLRIAAGERLTLAQDDLMIDGHAIEARVYAEDAFKGFLPQAGTASTVRWPALARVDHGFESGQTVSTSYDPMLGKIIVHAADREQARTALIASLDDTAIFGLTTNVGFLRELAASQEFAQADIYTAWLDTDPLRQPDPDIARAVAAWVVVAAAGESSTGPWHADGWRLGARPAAAFVALDEVVTVDRAAGISGGLAIREVVRREAARPRNEPISATDLIVDGERVSAFASIRPDATELVLRGQRYVFAAAEGCAAAGETDGTVVSPMPGTVVDVRVSDGDRVAAGAVLGTVEAMKMEHSLTAPFDGMVVKVSASAATQVALGDILFQVDPS